METDQLINKDQEGSSADHQNINVTTQADDQNHLAPPELSDHQNPSDSSFHRRKRDEQLHKKILIVVSIIYLLMFFALMAVFTFVTPFRVWYIDLIYSLKENSVSAFVTVFFVGLICILVGIPIFILEMIIGYIVKPLIYGIFLIIGFKMTGLTLAFFLGRYIFREKLKTIIQDNEYLDAFQDHIDENPFKIIFFLRVITIFPPILQDYGMGMLRISYKQFFCPVLLSIIIFAIFYAYLGKSIKNMYDYYSNPDKDEETYKDLAKNLIFLAFTIIVIAYFVRQVQKRLEIAKDETISQMSREEQSRRDSL